MLTPTIEWHPGGLKAAAAHLGYTFTRKHCITWASAFKANHPGVVVYGLGTSSDGQIAVLILEPSGWWRTVLAPVYA
jgi:hypothetical protein